MCAKIWGAESLKIRRFVTQKKYDHDLKSWSKSVFFDWLTGSIESAIICKNGEAFSQMQV